jgi:hypothetical protein
LRFPQRPLFFWDGRQSKSVVGYLSDRFLNDRGHGDAECHCSHRSRKKRVAAGPEFLQSTQILASGQYQPR